MKNFKSFLTEKKRTEGGTTNDPIKDFAAPQQEPSFWDKVGQGFQKLGFPKPGPDAWSVHMYGKTPPGNKPAPGDLGHTQGLSPGASSGTSLAPQEAPKPQTAKPKYFEGGKKRPTINAAYPPPTGGSGFSNPPEESGKRRAEGGQNLTDQDRANMPPIYNQGSEYGWEPTARVRMSQATRSMGHTGQPIDLSGPRTSGPPSTSSPQGKYFEPPADNPRAEPPKFTPSGIAPYRTKPDFDMTKSFRPSTNVVDRRGQIRPGEDVTPKLGMAHAGVNKAGETRQGSPGTQSGRSIGDSPGFEGGKKKQPSREHGGLLFYSPYEK